MSLTLPPINQGNGQLVAPIFRVTPLPSTFVLYEKQMPLDGVIYECPAKKIEITPDKVVITCENGKTITIALRSEVKG